jgi:GNAT superfamily N-acetyltransferase
MQGIHAAPAAIAHAPLAQQLRVRRATPDDAHDIARIACSVGNSVQDPVRGFLVHNYASDPLRSRSEFSRQILETDHFYVAEAKRVCGFLVAYDKERWLEYSPGWVSQISWHPDFDPGDLDRFVVIEKTAVMAGMTGQGIGSLLYDHLINKLRLQRVNNIFSETVISPVPNYASLEFRRKQRYELVGVRYERLGDTTYTCLVYRKRVPGVEPSV